MGSDHRVAATGQSIAGVVGGVERLQDSLQPRGKLDPGYLARAHARGAVKKGLTASFIVSNPGSRGRPPGGPPGIEKNRTGSLFLATPGVSAFAFQIVRFYGYTSQSLGVGRTRKNLQDCYNFLILSSEAS